MRKLAFHILLAGTAMLTVAPLRAQDVAAANTSQAEPSAADIIVTATRRETRLQTTASAVTAVTAAEIQTRGISDAQSLAAVTPGMSFGSTTQAQAHIAIRGVGSDSATVGQDPRVAYYQDGVYIARPTAQLGGVFDLDRIEVLKGPQGALYGRNATGGAVNVISKGPTEQLDGYLRASYGNYNDVTLDGAAGGAIASGFSARLALHYERRDGFGKNIVTGSDVDDKNAFGARLSVRWEPSSRLSFLTIADYNREHDHAFGLHFFGRGNPAVPVVGIAQGGVGLVNSRDVASDIDPYAHLQGGGINETIALNLDWATIKSITSYRKTSNHILSDFDGTSSPIFKETNNERARQVSQELTVSGTIGRLDWLTGALYFHEWLDVNTVGPISLAVRGGALNQIQQGLGTGGHLETDAFAPYFEFAYHLTDTVAVRAGGRYTHEYKSIDDVSQFDFTRPYSPNNPLVNNPPFPRSANVSYNNFVPSATIEWKASRNVFLYAKYSQGFKSGAFNISVNQPPFAPEKIKSYEAGVKTMIPEARAVFDVTVFHYDYSDLQVSEVRGTNAVIENAASAKLTGVEVLARVEPSTGLTLEASGSYLDAHYTDFSSINPVFASLGTQNLSGNRLTQAPKWALNGSIQKQWRIGDNRFTIRAEANYVSKVYFTPFDEEAISQSGYTLVNGSIRYDLGHHWSVEGFVRNIGNKKAVAQSIAASSLFGFPVVGTLIPPRTFGVRVGYTF